LGLPAESGIPGRATRQAASDTALALRSASSDKDRRIGLAAAQFETAREIGSARYCETG
jgi:hypothetical protein